MDEKPKHSIENEHRELGNAMRRIRQSRNYTAQYVAMKLGYKDESTYCRIERGEVENLSVWKIITFCKLFDCNIFHLFLLADIDIFDTNIKSWSEFKKSLSGISEEEAI